MFAEGMRVGGESFEKLVNKKGIKLYKTQNGAHSS
jgi:hypothetical protein